MFAPVKLDLGCVALRIATRDFADEPVDGVESVMGEEHERAFPGNDCDSALLAELNRFRAHSAATGGAIYPHVADSSFRAVAYDGLGDLGSRHQKGGIDTWFDVLYAARKSASRELGMLSDLLVQRRIRASRIPEKGWR